jgi:hypothetical protein
MSSVTHYLREAFGTRKLAQDCVDERSRDHPRSVHISSERSHQVSAVPGVQKIPLLFLFWQSGSTRDFAGTKDRHM